MGDRNKAVTLKKGGENLKPTPQQLEQLYRLSFILTSQMLKPINLVRMDERDSSLAMLAGDEIDITISKEGKVGYDQTEFQDNE